MNKRLIRMIKDLAGPTFYSNKSYSQEGEDLVINRLTQGKQNGFYIEIGCHHPFRFSNTYFLYRNGWKGICIDPLPGTKKLFNKWRPRDITLEMGISETASTLEYYMFNEPALNTFNADLAHERNKLNEYKIIDVKKIATNTLETILENLKITKEIDLFSIDVEGFDLEVLKSNNWSKFKPKIIIVECLTADLLHLQNDEICKFLQMQGYQPYAKTGYSVIFTQQETQQYHA